MSTQITTSPKVYIGLDIHKKTWTVSIQTDLFLYKTYSMPSKSCDLEQYVTNNFHNHEVYLVYEVGCCGFSVARYFLNLGWNVLVVNPADVKTGNKERYQKTDALDAKNLSNQLKSGTLKGINIPTEDEDQFTSLARHRTQVTKKLRTTKLHIKSLLLFHAIEIPVEYDNSNWSNGFIEWLEKVKFSTTCGDLALQGKIRMYKFVKTEYLEIANQMRAYCRKSHKEDYNLLKSIPGIGGYLASVIIAECGDLRRFNTEGQFASFVGIVPGIHNSGGSEKCLGITPRSRSQLRSYLIEAAWMAVRKDLEMQQYYRKHQGKNVKSIIVKVAHKMTRRILAVIKTQTPYKINKNIVLEKSIA
ncbi:IS110 family RNA-guided transposase [Flavobacterium frigoris]|uniref:Transposase n=1 Tax=Flavobacterium frigoris TaxID=229204 RepID=A0A1H9KIN1_FLAFI|nr:IS110 family transposase [Flavobacterium frigoris]SEQ99024.1 Transposase [Flavobacterium frigoris]